MSDPLGLISGVGGAGGVNPVRNAAPIDGVSKVGGVGGSGGAPGGPDFREVLMDNIQRVNRLQQDAEMAIEDFATGKRNDMAGVTMATQKADMAFQMLLQVRNKMMDAYEEVKQIRV
ncbi:MAG: flagellar hook-basal body complex protein FliE [Planctomycetota bacterium]